MMEPSSGQIFQVPIVKLSSSSMTVGTNKLACLYLASFNLTSLILVTEAYRKAVSPLACTVKLFTALEDT